MLEYYRFKVINELFLNGQTEEAYMQLLELQKKYVDLCDENRNYQAQIKEYEDILYLARNFVFDGSFYWLITGSIKQGPFCPNCYNRDGQLVRITDMRPKRCNHCGEIFELPQSPAKQRGNTVRALDQAAAVGSLRAFAAMEQTVEAALPRIATERREAMPESALLKVPRSEAGGLPGKCKVIQFVPRS